jgi:protein gp37
VRFLSIEPLLEGLGAIDLSGINWVMVGGKKAVLELALWRRNG